VNKGWLVFQRIVIKGITTLLKHPKLLSEQTKRSVIMTKADFLALAAQKSGQTKAATSDALDAILATITEVIVNEEKITFPGFGTFSQSKRAARTGRNPKTGAELQIAASKCGKFTAGKNLKNM
jgi:DNA-binding protein HU-beta